MTAEQAKLLQIGDIVIKERKNSEDAVSYLDFEGNCSTISLVKDRQAFSPNEIGQIPLTDEILEKNGFSINVFENCMYYDFPKNAGFDELIKAHYHLIKYNSDDYYFFEDCPFIKAKTVDEFQRLLRLMGFVDFSNNFKV